MRPLAAIGAILLMIGFVVRAVSVSDGSRIAEFGETPDRLTLKTLIDRGPRGPKNVIITNYLPCENYIVEERILTDRTGKSEISVERAYVPLTPAVRGPDGRVDTRPLRAHVIVHIPDLKDEKEIATRCAGPELQGLVVGTASELDEKARKLLAEKYPDSQFDRCLVITEGEKVSPVAPPSFTRKASLWMAALGCVLLGIASVLWMERRAVSHRS